jgi:hypothetical protein
MKNEIKRKDDVMLISYSRISQVVSLINGLSICSYNSSINVSMEFIDKRRATGGGCGCGGGGGMIGSGVLGTGDGIETGG